jgi:hypothetical protein
LAPFSRASDKPIAIACLRLFTFRPLPDFSVPFLRRRIALSTRFDAAFPYLRPREDFLAAISRPPRSGLKLSLVGLAHVVPEKSCVPTRTAGFFYGEAAMTRAGLEAEAISRLTEGIEPREVRAILVQCLAGELAPSAAISRMLTESGAANIRFAIDEVTERAATISRASDMLVHDRVDELTQVFVEMVAAVGDTSEAAKSRGRSEYPHHPEV